MATWKAVDISSCPVQTLTAKEGVVMSPNYPHFLLANLQCTTTILAPGNIILNDYEVPILKITSF